MTGPETGTQVATRQEPKLSATQLMLTSPHAEDRQLAYQAARGLARAKMIQETATALSGTQWGRGISPEAAVAIAKWGLEAGVDPVRHIYVLGGKIYDNAELYLDKLASMPSFDRAEYTILAPLDHRKIEKLGLRQEQEAQLLREQQDLNAERIRLQMQYEVPNNVNDFPNDAAAVLVKLYFKDGSTAVGVNWAGSRGRKKGQQGGSYDPVGDAEPVKTAITRAIRKAAKQKVPVWFKDGAVGERFEQAEGLVTQGREVAKLSKGEPTSTTVEGLSVDVSGGKPVSQEAAYEEQQLDTTRTVPSDPPGDAMELKEGEVEIVCPNCGQVEIVDAETVKDGISGYDCSAGCRSKMFTRQWLAERKGGR